jgi:hypothetical protein
MNIQSGLNVSVPVAPRGARSYPELLQKLSLQSVRKRYLAYEDVPWDDPAYRLDPDDSRWELPGDDPLARTAWYAAQPPAVRSRIGLHLAASLMKIGVQFESVLKRGLLRYAGELPNGSLEFRYAYHEVAEETQHSMMFQEFVNRSSFDPQGLRPWQLWVGARFAQEAHRIPAVFFVAVLAGEEPIDHVQRALLRSDRELPPVLERIMRIHVTEEARHLCFAREFLRERAPRIGRAERLYLRVRTPLLLRVMAQSMLSAPPDVAAMHGIPRNVLEEAYGEGNELHASRVRDAVKSTRELCEELGVLVPATRPLWRKLQLVA